MFSELWEFELNHTYLKGETFDVIFLTEMTQALAHNRCSEYVLLTCNRKSVLLAQEA